MMNIDDDLQRLGKLDEEISSADGRIETQRGMLMKMRQDGKETSLAIDVLVCLQEGRQRLIECRELLRQEIESHRRGYGFAIWRH